MNVREIFRRLSLGELSNLSIGEEGSGNIVEDKQNTIVLYLNDGLKRLYSRFILREANIILEMSSGITNYKLHPMYAVSSQIDNRSVCHPYIMDTCEDPFIGDLIRVLSVSNQCGVELPLNDEATSYSLFTPQTDVLQVPVPIEGNILSIVYQAYHTYIPDNRVDFQVDIPMILEGALIAYIAMRVYQSMNTQEATLNAQGHLSTYEAICLEVETKNLLGTGIKTQTSKFEKNGWK